MDAKVVGVPPFSEPESSEMVLPLLPLCCKANKLPSREAFDQGYCVYWHKTLGPAETPPPSLVSRVKPVPSVLTFHRPFLLVSTFVEPKPLFSTSSNRLVLPIA